MIVRGMGDWTDNAVQAMQQNPPYFAWWYTVKSIGLAAALAGLAYMLGREQGRRT